MHTHTHTVMAKMQQRENRTALADPAFGQYFMYEVHPAAARSTCITEQNVADKSCTAEWITPRNLSTVTWSALHSHVVWRLLSLSWFFPLVHIQTFTSGTFRVATTSSTDGSGSLHGFLWGMFPSAAHMHTSPLHILVSHILSNRLEAVWKTATVVSAVWTHNLIWSCVWTLIS